MNIGPDAAVKGRGEKKRIALAHFLFNLIADLIAFMLMMPLLILLTQVLGTRGPLHALVAFHSSFNLVGIALFLPFVQQFAGFLGRRFVELPRRVAEHTIADTLEVPEAVRTTISLNSFAGIKLNPIYDGLIMMRNHLIPDIAEETAHQINDSLKEIEHESMHRLYRHDDALDLSEVELSTMLDAARERRPALRPVNHIHRR